jgi:hypothetical protein
VGELTSRIYVHAALRQVPCVLCGILHDHQYVAAGLFEGDRFLGDICPLCLVAGPPECANRVRTYVGPPIGDLAKFVRRQIMGSEDSEDPRRRNGHVDDLESPDAFGVTLSDSELLGYADILARMEKWSVTLEDVIQSERSALRQRFSGLYDEDLRRLVDDRYTEFFEDSPQIQPRH